MNIRPLLQVGLTTAGELELILSDGRSIPLRTGEVQTTLKRVLQGMIAQQSAIGLDGAPTRQQAIHWQSHSIFHNDRCAFCRSERQAEALLIARPSLKAKTKKVSTGSLPRRWDPNPSHPPEGRPSRQCEDRRGSRTMTQTGVVPVPTTQISLITDEPFLDITNPQSDIEIELRADRQVLWVNVGGICRLRICRIGDHRIHITGPAPDRI